MATRAGAAKAVRACVFCNGDLGDPAAARGVAQGCDLIVCADGGSRHALDLGLRPHVLVGDLDSLPPGARERLPGVEFVVHPAAKDATDAELAVELALVRGASTVVLLGATGGRLDHGLGNVGLVVRHPGRVALRDGNTVLSALDERHPLRVEAPIGTVVSLLALGGAALGVRSCGLEYPLRDEPLEPGGRGVSNVMRQGSACVCTRRGQLLCCAQAGRLVVWRDGDEAWF